ncbi:unnamed protein product [Clonostachys rosea]|uniref:Uncharacterized protein n=1 Tax=Bionectria ochroleuca TaxID=29856 RepID=A0ABY6TND8_BIOOC|nr:unnamed protein product [Clonostachys rosea]
MLTPAYEKAPAARGTFQAYNITSHSKRAVSAATCMMGGGFGGIIPRVAFIVSESPHYITGIRTTFALSIASTTAIMITDLHLWRATRAGKAVKEGMEGWKCTLWPRIRGTSCDV